MSKKILLVLMILFLCGCAAQEETYSTETEDNHGGTETAGIQTDDMNTANIEINGNTIDFTGLGETDSPDGYGNLPINQKQANYDAVFCTDREGHIYYSNHADNDRLYEYADGESRKLTDIKAVYINCIGDDLYFISPNGSIGEPSSSGEIYRYDRSEGTCELYLEEKASVLVAVQDGLYYIKNEIQKTETGSRVVSSAYYRGFEADTSEKCDAAYPLIYMDYHLVWNGEEEVYKLKNEAEEVTVYDNSRVLWSNACIYKGRLYYTYDRFSSLSVLDLTNGTEKDYPKEELALASYQDQFSLSDYTVLGENIYIAYGASSLLKIDSDGSITLIDSKDNDTSIYTKLFTDGTDLYALTWFGSLCKLEFGEDGSFSSQIIGE